MLYIEQVGFSPINLYIGLAIRYAIDLRKGLDIRNYLLYPPTNEILLIFQSIFKQISLIIYAIF